MKKASKIVITFSQYLCMKNHVSELVFYLLKNHLYNIRGISQGPGLRLFYALGLNLTRHVVIYRDIQITSSLALIILVANGSCRLRVK